ncbi:MAG: RagB/SusD family nutrient uptake outer membrane protein [Chitinophagaceae bacterium]
MKRIAILTLIAAPMLLGGCKKFLDKEYDSAFTKETIYANEDDARKAVNAVYALFNQDAYTSRVSNIFTGNSDIEIGGVGASADNSRRDIWSFEATDANGDLRVVYQNGYSAINRANDCIEGIKASPLYQSGNVTFKNLLGEASALRAYWYYLLMNHFGDIPFRAKATVAGDSLYLGRTDRDSILTYLINDLRAVEEDMSWADALDFGIERINREFVLGFIARLSLMRGGYWLYPDMVMRRKDDYLQYYQIARDYCKKLMDLKPHTLNPNFLQIFKNQCENLTPENEDILWEVAFHPGFGDVGWCQGVKVDAGEHDYGSGSNYLSLSPHYMYSFDTLDQRLDATCNVVYYTSATTNTYFDELPVAVSSIAPAKWNRLWLKAKPGKNSAKGTGINWPVMRYSDVLLMYAEAENELNNGPTGEAIAALKAVRQRAFPSSAWGEKVDGYVASVSGGKQAFFEAIVDERAWEFGGECLRKYDLARWNNYGEKLDEAYNTLFQMGADTYAGTGAYSGLPGYLYYKKNSDGSLNFLTKYRRPEVEPPVKDVPTSGANPNGYIRVNWLRSLYNNTTQGPANFILYSWRGYMENKSKPVKYIMPIHSSQITASLGRLNNDGYQY